MQLSRHPFDVRILHYSKQLKFYIFLSGDIQGHMAATICSFYTAALKNDARLKHNRAFSMVLWEDGNVSFLHDIYQMEDKQLLQMVSNTPTK